MSHDRHFGRRIQCPQQAQWFSLAIPRRGHGKNLLVARTFAWRPLLTPHHPRPMPTSRAPSQDLVDVPRWEGWWHHGADERKGGWGEITVGVGEGRRGRDPEQAALELCDGDLKLASIGALSSPPHLPVHHPSHVDLSYSHHDYSPAPFLSVRLHHPSHRGTSTSP